jgi:circadian clock protein KaiC
MAMESEPQGDLDLLEKIPTGIEGFEHISLGGLVAGRTTLLVGTSGSGKTVFTVELLYRSINEFDRNGVFVTFEERPADIVRNVRRLGWDLSRLVEAGRLHFVDGSFDRSIVEESGTYDLSGIVAQIRYAVETVGAKLVILDSLGALFHQFANPGILRREIFRITDVLQGLGVTSVMTSERLDEYGPISRHGIEEFVTDCVIVLRHVLEEEHVRRTIQIHKMRGALHHDGQFPFLIDDRGFSILPLSAMELKQQSSTERISFGNADLDVMAGGGLFRDSIILVSGPTGGGKTLMCATFVAESCRKGERVLLLGYEESREQLLRNAQSWGVDFEKWETQGLLRMVCRYPESQGLEGHLLSIRREIETFKPRRLVMDSVSALERIANLRVFREFLIGLTSYVKQEQVCTLLTCTTPELSGGESITESHISTITDAIILLRYVMVDTTLRRGMIIIKMRGSQHAKDIREFTIDSQGLHVGKPLGNIHDILSGIPSAESAAKSRS